MNCDKCKKFRDLYGLTIGDKHYFYCGNCYDHIVGELDLK